LEAPK